MMGLRYPGGPVIEKLALAGNEERFDLPVPLRNSPLTAFSLSGLKNAVRLVVQSLGGAEAMSDKDRADLSASFQKAVISHLIQKSKKVLSGDTIADFAIVGGASANLAIRNAYEKLCLELGKRLHTVPLEYCSDNAAMIGRCALEALEREMVCSPHEITVSANRKLQSGMKL
jgi:N6-L-threonylcarbamoyladenine synthase